MRRLCIGIAVVVMGVLLMPGVADSAAEKKRAVDITVKAAVVDSANGVNTVAGALSGKPFGSGAVVYKSRTSGSDIAATYKAFYAKGTLRGHFVAYADAATRREHLVQRQAPGQGRHRQVPRRRGQGPEGHRHAGQQPHQVPHHRQRPLLS